MDIRLRKAIALRSVALLILAGLVVAYFLFGVRAAEIHVSCPILDFPVFLGEIVLFVVLGLAVMERLLVLRQRSWKTCALGAYLLWVLLKAVEGYFSGGAYALRNAALFYYPLFGFLIFFFLQGPLLEAFEKRRNSLPIVLPFFTVAAGLFFGASDFFSRYVSFIVMIVCLFLSRRTVRKFLFVVFAFVLLLTGPQMISSRSHILGLAVGFSSVVLFVLARMRAGLWMKAVFAIAGFLALCLVLMIITDPNARRTLVDWDPLRESYVAYQSQIDSKEDFFWAEMPVRVYNPTAVLKKDPKREDVRRTEKRTGVSNSPGFGKQDQSTGDLDAKASAVRRFADPVGPEISAGSRPDVLLMTGVPASEVEEPCHAENIADSLMPGTKDQTKPVRPLDTAYNNILFRYFIWRDMVREFLAFRPVFGFSFGHPQRSKSLETLRWGETEWLTVGWVTPHNSYLHLIYRGGIVGVAFIAVMIGLLFLMIRKVIRSRSVPGGLLVSAIIYGVVATNFLVFLELPYTAIPFWCLWGATQAVVDHELNSQGGE